jgi:hypothetical protein
MCLYDALLILGICILLQKVLSFFLRGRSKTDCDLGANDKDCWGALEWLLMTDEAEGAEV